MTDDPKTLTEAEWRERLSAEQFHVLREAGTERAFTGKYDKFYEEGEYVCAGCGTRLFISAAKYNSGCGWPAFTKPADEDVIDEHRDQLVTDRLVHQSRRNGRVDASRQRRKHATGADLRADPIDLFGNHVAAVPVRGQPRSLV